MELQNIISAESVRDLLTQARKAGWEHLIYSMGGDQTTKGDISWHQHVWRHGTCQISMDLGRIDITSQAAAHAHGSAATGWSFPVETLDMDGLTLTLSVALAQFGYQTPSTVRTEQEIAILDSYHGQKSTNCAGGCCYNALKDECVNDGCQCHS